MDFLLASVAEGVNSLGNLSFGAKLTMSVGLTFALYYKAKVCKVPRLVSANGKLRKFIEENVPIAHEKFSPLCLIFGTTLQTIAGAVFRSEPNVKWDEAEDIDLPDGGEVHLHWLHGSDSSRFTKSNKPTVLLLPGLTGNEQSSYICHFAKLLENHGYRTVVFTYRGMGGKLLKTARSYCACNTDDMEHVVQHIKNKHPDAPLLAVGVSLGAMILFHYLVRTGTNSGLLAAMTVSMPWDPFESVKTLSTPLNATLFNRRLAKKLVAFAEAHSHLFDRVVNFDHVRESNTIHEFDESFTTRVFGFDSLDHYYASSRTADKVHKILIPLLALNSEDDPFSPGYCIPVQDIAESDHLVLLLTERGGHVGFIDTFSCWGTQYIDRLFIQYIEAVFKNQDTVEKIISD